MRIHLIAAVARNRAIGYHNRLLYWLPNDLKRFKALTMGHTVIMGRHTFESLPKGALPHRRNIVLSRTQTAFPGCDCYPSLEAALQSCAQNDEVYIIGGEQVYRQALPLAHRLFLTEVVDTPSASDAFFPPYDDWHVEHSEAHPKDEQHAFAYTFVDYTPGWEKEG